MIEVLTEYKLDEDTGMCWIGINVESKENGATAKERWLHAVKILRETADKLETEWNK